MDNDNYSNNFMGLALQQAQIAFNSDEVPVGAVIVKNGIICGSGFNQVIQKKSVVAHAEINAINSAAKHLNNYRLIGCDMYVSLEPCHMCAKAIVDARINNLFFGALEPKNGAIVSVDRFLDRQHLNHIVSYSHGYFKDDATKLMQSFFQSKRSSPE
ncbi:nucleoside deaminase [Gammaproteobacteria bacterium]|jgi:tRNA(adenine34) deaminase|nr:nucleoside deaminase [Gammaproteobacteria bacterium]MDB4183462.1 nucleoside deaminase [Gammaproteobacteria bacterium]